MAWDTLIPRHGLFRYINSVSFERLVINQSFIFYLCLKQPFNKKENAFIVIMASAAANSALGTEVLAVQRMYYNFTPNPAAGIL